ncbi:monoamine oxidase [Mucilaginibacter mallensis]|uniref:Monoamine oxidase n=1 Tax=Mucilaginibacter mallensis TaxID=652787 RepID=A0A1H1YUT0_MUCMA|nr:NAD(P)/FAD-dependent oxidoreductase [Mucilaginibacter mallensis]SDT25211.1 monoamine oxidase [Mucilaginibacter mallensis]
MAHNSITRLLQSAFHTALREDEEALVSFNEWNEGRRRFLKQAAIAGAGVMLTPPLLSLTSCNKTKNNDIAIIGAGIAGLNAAYQLQKKGIKATVYEASGRIGGRMYTLHDEFGKGITTDVGGEFVDSTHADILQLAKELGLSFYDLRTDPLIRKTFYFGGQRYSEADLVNALKPFVAQLVKDITSLPDIISYHSAAKFQHLDNQSIDAYLKSIGITGWLYDYLHVTLTREYGMEASIQSAVNFLIMFVAPVATEKSYELFGPDHEVFKIKGGSMHLTTALYEKVNSSVKTGYKFIGIEKNESQGYDLKFDQNGTITTVTAARVIIAIPFTILRGIDFKIPMPEGKRKCIDEIGYGNSSKFFIGVTKKPWRAHGEQGYTFTDLDFGCGWDGGQMQSENEGTFTVFGGGDFSDMVNSESTEVLAAKFVPALNTIYPGMDEAFSKKTIKFLWQNNPYSKAAYSSFKIGQWSTLAGWEGVPVGDIYFAGEHVSRDFQGYMNGGAQTGRVAVETMLKAMAINS